MNVVEEKGTMKLIPFDYSDVKLLDGKYKKQFCEMIEYFLAIPNDDILLGFRRRAGMPNPGNELGGWYSNDGSFNIYDWDEIFNVFGQWLSLFGRAYKVTGDERLRDKSSKLIDEWGKTIEEDGYFFYSKFCNAHHYVYEKTVSGLIDCYVYAGLEKAKGFIDKITTWAENNLSRKRLPANCETSSFTAGDQELNGEDNEWYTLSECIYRVYLATGDERYKEFAAVWHYNYYWDAILQGNEDYMTSVHGYSHVNTLGGAALAYRVLGDKKYLETIVKSYEIFKKNQLMANGGYAHNEHMASPQGSNNNTIETAARTFEVPCGSWAVFKLVRHLISLTGEAKYGDWAETILYNAIGASLPMSDDCRRRGRTFYYTDMRIGGGRKVYFEHSFPCCAGTYPQAVTEYNNMIYYQSEKDIYVTQYIPSYLDTNIAGAKVGIQITGNYPRVDNFEIKVFGCGEFTVVLRVPSWLKDEDGSIAINGVEEDIKLVANDWVKIKRIWSDEDVIKVTYPMNLWLSPIHSNYPERTAIMYGPIMLAAKGRVTSICGDITNINSFIKQTDDFTFEACLKDGKKVKFIPYEEFIEKEWYTIYFDVMK